MNGSNIQIRRARPGDEPGIANVHIKSWQEAYRELIPQAYLDNLSNEVNNRTNQWQKTLSNPQRWCWVAENSHGIIGFILFGLPRDANRDGFIELGAIYLLEQYKGKKIGFELLSTGFQFMKSLGYKMAYCWVLENNPTTNFYEGTGASYSGMVKTDKIGGVIFNELAYQWDSLDLTRNGA